MNSKIIFALIVFCQPFFLFSQKIYISPNGNDSQDGSIIKPVKTIERANELVKVLLSSNTKNNIYVFLRGGTYYLQKPVIFDNSLSAKNGNQVIYSSYPEETAIISGGKKINQWANYSNSIIQADVGGLRFRQLYQNGRRCTRAREPNFCKYNRILSYDSNNKSLAIDSSEIPEISSYSTELVLQKHWNIDILRLKEVLEKNDTVSLLFKNPEISRTFAQDFPSKESGQVYHLENDRNFIDNPSEWSLDDSGKIFFYPYGDHYQRGTLETEIPVIEKLFIIKGSSLIPVRNIVIKNIVFELTNWNLSSYIGYNGIQAGVINWASKYQPTPSALFIQNAENILILGNHFRNLGGHGLIVYSATKNTKIEGNVFSDISANAIVIDFNLEGEKHLTRKSYGELCENITISNNYITRAGQDYYGSVGIFIGYASNIEITNNLLEDLPYTGISVGWGWSNEISPLKNITVKNNIIDGAMKRLDDGAGIYLLSNQPGTITENNIITNIVKSEWAGPTGIFAIYLDEGSDNISISNNLIDSHAEVWISPLAGNNISVKNAMDDQNLKAGLSEEFVPIVRKGKEKSLNLMELNCSQQEKSIEHNDFLIFPNPTKDNFKISIPFDFECNYLEVSVLSTDGTIVFSKKYFKEEMGNEITIDSKFISNLYVVLLKSSKELLVRKLLVTK